jgi:hypothetical protein
MWSTTFEHFFQLCGMAAILWGSRAFSLRTQGDRTRAEGERLRRALTISIKALHKHYEDNLVSFCCEKLPLSSGRNQINLLRTQLGRLTLLDPPEIEAIMAASVAVEVAETEFARCGGRGRAGGAAFAIPEKPELRTVLRSALRDACSTLRAAEELLNPKKLEQPEAKSVVPTTCTMGESFEAVEMK